MNTDTQNQSFFPSSPPDYLQNWIELSQSAVEHNAQQFKQWLGSTTQIAGVIKSNAYGHGLVEMAQMYEQCDNIAALCVINLSEAIQIRQHGIKKPIFVVGYLDAPYDLIVQHAIQVILYDLQTAYQLNEIGKKYQQPIQVHIKFDTGMARLGVTPTELPHFIHEIQMLPWISINSIFTHFAESYNQERTGKQEAIFAQATALPYATHASNSHGALTTQHKEYDFARLGIGLYGYLQRQIPEIQKSLKPVLSLKTKILQIKSVQAGDFVGYDGMFQAQTDMTIAILAIGYHEGLDARLSNLGSVIIHGKFAPIIGRICMNLSIVNITAIPDCHPGSIVTVLGTEGDASISAYDWSSITKASVYTHLTKLSSTLPKLIIP